MVRTSARHSRPSRSASARARAGVGRIVLHGQPRALHVQQADRQGVADDVVQLPGDPVPLLGPGLLGQARLGLPQLPEQVPVVPDQQAERDRQGDAGQPGAPAGIGLDPQPLGREQEHRPGPVGQALAAGACQHAPAGQQAHREPADVARHVVPEHRDPGGRDRGVEQHRPPAQHEQRRRADRHDRPRHGDRRARVEPDRPGRGDRGEHDDGGPSRPARQVLGRARLVPDRRSCCGFYGRPSPGGRSAGRAGVTARCAGPRRPWPPPRAPPPRSATRWRGRGRATARAPRWSAASAAAGPRPA